LVLIENYDSTFLPNHNSLTTTEQVEKNGQNEQMATKKRFETVSVLRTLPAEALTVAVA
jgi:hypothetical protein